jgi:hypothetical protein
MASAAGDTQVQLRVVPADPRPGRQFAAYLGTPTRARGYPPIEGDNALIIEVAPALAIERVTDLALKSVPEIEPGILYVERQFGVLEVHHADQELVDRAGAGDSGGDRCHARGCPPGRISSTPT